MTTEAQVAALAALLVGLTSGNRAREIATRIVEAEMTLVPTAEIARLRKIEEAARVRPVVAWFATEMERQLRENDYKGGWERCDINWLLTRLGQELGELRRAVEGGKQAAMVVDEAADVANFALMVADNIGSHPARAALEAKR